MTLLLKNAHIIDGSGGEPFRGDILINGDTISAVGNFQHKKTDDTIDCQGAFVAPGFIDSHSTTDHYGSLLRHPEQDHYLEQGITSAIGGYDGISLAPFTQTSKEHFSIFHSGRSMNVDWASFGEFLETLRRIRPSINFGSLVGYHHGIALVEHALREGAFGVSLGTVQLPRAAEKALDAVMLHHHTVLSLPHAPRSAQELKRLSKLSDGGVKVVLHNVVPFFAPEKEYESVLQHVSDYGKSNLMIAMPASEFVTMPIASLLPEWVRALDRTTILEKLSDAWLRKKIVADIPDIDPAQLKIVHAPHLSSIIGLTLKDIMQHHAIRDEKEALVNVMRTSELRAGIHVAQVATKYTDSIMQLPNVLIGSFEPGAYRTEWNSYDVSHGFLDLLWKAEQKGIGAIVSLSSQLTTRPVKFFGIQNRGVIKEGMHADVVGFKNKSVKFTVVNGMLMRGGQPL